MKNSMKPTLSYYKKLYKNLNRLPLDVGSLNLAKSKARDAFRNGRSIPNAPVEDPKWYHKVMKTTDEVLKGDNFLIHKVLDLLYKDSEPQQPWVKEFINTKYSAFKPVWPTVHLLHEFGQKKHISRYDKELANSSPELKGFLLMNEMKLSLPRGETPIKPLRKIHSKSSIEEVLEKVKPFYLFVLKHSETLLDVKLKPLEVLHEPTSYGLPKSVASRERDIRTKVSSVKDIIQRIRPLTKKHMFHLGEVASGRSNDSTISINENFFRYASRQHDRNKDISPYEKKYILHKQLIPNERNIRFFYKEYVIRQFFENDKGDYQMSPFYFYD